MFVLQIIIGITELENSLSRQQKMEMYQQNIPTIKHVHKQLKQAYSEIDYFFVQIGIVPLSTSQDIQNKKVTINQVISKIPTQQRLQNIINFATKTQVKTTILNYEGQISLIQQAKKNYNQLKKQQQKIYYLAIQSGLNTVSPQFKEKVSPSTLTQLNSYTKVAEVKKTKMKTLQKNNISDSYLSFEEGKAQLDKNQPVIKCARKTQQIKKFDLLIHVNFYDSHNMEKQYQFICIQQQLLGSLVQKFKCLIDTLKNIQKIRRKQPQIQKQPFQIYDKFHQPLPQRNINKTHGFHRFQRAQDVSPPSLKYLVIQDTIYYEGNKNDLEPLLSLSSNQGNKIRYRCFEFSKTKLSDIRVIFGKPYLYRHLQGCDHIVIFKQARLFMGNDQFNHDILEIEKYPITVYQSRMKRKKCEGCSLYFTDFVTVGDPLKNGDNLYLCRYCHKDLHYDENGKQKKQQMVKIINYIHD